MGELTYTQKSVSAIYNPQGLFLFLPPIHHPSIHKEVMFSTWNFARASAITSKEKNPKENSYDIPIRIITEPGGCTLKTRTILQINNTPSHYRHKISKKEKSHVYPSNLPDLGCHPIPGA